MKLLSLRELLNICTCGSLHRLWGVVPYPQKCGQNFMLHCCSKTIFLVAVATAKLQRMCLQDYFSLLDSALVLIAMASVCSQKCLTKLSELSMGIRFIWMGINILHDANSDHNELLRALRSLLVCSKHCVLMH